MPALDGPLPVPLLCSSTPPTPLPPSPTQRTGQRSRSISRGLAVLTDQSSLLNHIKFGSQLSWADLTAVRGVQSPHTGATPIRKACKSAVAHTPGAHGPEGTPQHVHFTQQRLSAGAPGGKRDATASHRHIAGASCHNAARDSLHDCGASVRPHRRDHTEAPGLRTSSAHGGAPLVTFLASMRASGSGNPPEAPPMPSQRSGENPSRGTQRLRIDSAWSAFTDGASPNSAAASSVHLAKQFAMLQGRSEVSRAASRDAIFSGADVLYHADKDLQDAFFGPLPAIPASPRVA